MNEVISLNQAFTEFLVVIFTMWFFIFQKATILRIFCLGWENNPIIGLNNNYKTNGEGLRAIRSLGQVQGWGLLKPLAGEQVCCRIVGREPG